MKIRPVILCGGAGTRLWPNSKNHQAKQFIDFGKWTLLDKTLERTKASIYDAPIISTNKKYLKQVKQHLKKNKIKKYKIVLEPAKRNTAPAILSTAFVCVDETVILSNTAFKDMKLKLAHRSSLSFWTSLIGKHLANSVASVA